MKKVISSERIPIKLWLDDLEESAVQQAKNVANLPFTYKHVVVNADGHSGYGVPIGGVMATEGVVVPFAVGSDIGCGMVSLRTKFFADDIDKRGLVNITNKIKQLIPVGQNWNTNPVDMSQMPQGEHTSVVGDQLDRARYQLSSLGQGNHFLELQVSLSDNRIWVMIHSGSRNLGYKIAEHYDKRAKFLNQLWHSSVPAEWKLAFLPLGVDDAKDYLLDMQYCVDFALANRKLMMERVLQAFEHEMKTEEVADGNMINIAHNYARMESHFGKNVLVHRKGATSARKGEVGIIPGSQGTKSYIVMGLGNEESFQSCSHGAGRKMGRKDAQRRLDLEIEKKKLDDQGIIHGIKNVEDLDEAAGAYKDIDVVMENQSDLVSIIHELSPLAVVKG